MKERAAVWFEGLRDRLCVAFEAIEAEAGSSARFERKTWKRPADDGGEAGGGVIGVMRGKVFEKVGVNVSTVYGRFAPEFAKSIPGAGDDPAFWAGGISVVAHMANPHVPAAHMNTRHIVTTKSWFGGGADLTPMLAPVPEDTADFHAALKAACDRFDAAYYPRFKQWCDEYFFLPHRGEARGAGGIFFDGLDSGDKERDFAFTQAVGMAFLDIYPQIIRRRMAMAFTEADRLMQLERRGRYVEFNLLYDRGTQFGLKTGGNAEAILMSLPPLARWG